MNIGTEGRRRRLGGRLLNVFFFVKNSRESPEKWKGYFENGCWEKRAKNPSIISILESLVCVEGGCVCVVA